MTISPLSGGPSGDEVWGDFSGGEIVIAIAHTGYTSNHILRVLPFDTSGTALFLAPPGGTTTGVGQEADNLIALIAALYPAAVTVSAVLVNQTLNDHTGEVPYAFTFGGGGTSAGTGGGAENPVPNVLNFNGRGADGSRWRFTAPGFSNAIGSDANKIAIGSLTGAAQALAKYLTGQTNGGVHAVKTNVVTHNGVPIVASGFTVTSMINKRLRRHFKLV